MLFSSKYRYLYVLILATYTYINTEICRIYSYFSLPIRWYEAYISIVVITLLTWEFSRWIEPLFTKWFYNEGDAIKRFFFFFLSSLAGSFILTILTVITFEVLVLNISISLDNPLKLTLTYTSLVCLLYHLVNVIVYYMHQYKTKQLEAAELQRLSAQAELQRVKSQINPHFLFNNLNVLSSLVLQNNSDANNFIEAFSKVYQYILRNHDKEMIELKEELEFLNPYIYLLEKRFPACVHFDLNIDKKWHTKYIVPVALQMLIENAIKHNIASRARPLYISLRANGKPELEVINNLQPKISHETSSNIGLSNINLRYEKITGMNISIYKSASEFKVILPLIETEHDKGSYH